MPSKSKRQQRLMGMAYAYAKGDLPNASKAVKKIAKSFLKKDRKTGLKNLRDFASTKHDGLKEKKILTFTEFDSNFLLENNSKMMIFYSDSFRKILEVIASSNFIGRDVAKVLVSIENKEDSLDSYTLIDKTDKNDMISYVQTNRIQRENPNMDLSDKDNKFWKQGRTPYYSIGRWVRHIFSDVLRKDIDGKDLEYFVNTYKAEYDQLCGNSERFEIVEGDDIRHWYLGDSYREMKGQLGKSCMKHERCQKYFDIYVDNPEVCKLLILKSDDDRNKIIGRALIWNLKGGGQYMDRIYTVSESDRVLFEKYAEERGISRYCRDVVMVKPKEYQKYPYMDTFILYYYNTGILTPSPLNYKDDVLELTSTTGDSIIPELFYD